MLNIRDLQVSVGEKDKEKNVLKGINLMLKAGEVHAMMGPNGSGKSTLANVLAGHPGYHLKQGAVSYKGEDLLALSPEERAQAGLFLSFQYPIEIPGVSNIYFLKSALNAIRKARGEAELDAVDFLARVKSQLDLVGLDQDFLYRSVNEGFSGGEKKRNEILQMAVLEPQLAILDETDSGLDIDALHTLSNGIKKLRNPERAILIITHYPNLLNDIQPDKVHILSQGTIVCSGDASLVNQVEKYGYEGLLSSHTN